MGNGELISDDRNCLMPDIIGYTLNEAKFVLDKIGAGIHDVKITAPPREKREEPDGSCRVIKVKVDSNNMLELLVCKPL